MGSPATLVRVYKGKQQSDANNAFGKDARDLAKQHYYPTTQSWAQGQWGCGAWLMALVLCVVLVGILVFIYMLIVKPAGTLTVTYEYREPVTAVPAAQQVAAPYAFPPTGSERAESHSPSMPCPRCAETIKVGAKMCRFCSLDLTGGPQAG